MPGCTTRRSTFWPEVWSQRASEYRPARLLTNDLTETTAWRDRQVCNSLDLNNVPEAETLENMRLSLFPDIEVTERIDVDRGAEQSVMDVG